MGIRKPGLIFKFIWISNDVDKPRRLKSPRLIYFLKIVYLNKENPLCKQVKTGRYATRTRDCYT